MQFSKYDLFFERIPGRCGGRVTIKGRRLEPGLFYNEHKNGRSATELAKDFGVAVEEVKASTALCQEWPDILAEYEARNVGRWRGKTTLLSDLS